MVSLELVVESSVGERFQEVNSVGRWDEKKVAVEKSHKRQEEEKRGVVDHPSVFVPLVLEERGDHRVLKEAFSFAIHLDKIGFAELEDAF